VPVDAVLVDLGNALTAESVLGRTVMAMLGNRALDEA
jgi:hypothetical protein